MNDTACILAVNPFGILPHPIERSGC